MSMRGKKVIPSVENPGSIVGSWLFTVAWLGFTIPFFYKAVIVQSGTGGGLVLGLLLLVGLAMLVGSVLATIEYMKFGKVFLLLPRELPAVGGTLNALLRLPPGSGSQTRVNAGISCVARVWRKSGKGSIIVNETLYSFNHGFPVRPDVRGTTVEIQFDIPVGLPATDTPTVRPVVEHVWQVSVEADIPGVNLHRTFKLYVGLPQPGAIRRSAGVAAVQSVVVGSNTVSGVAARDTLAARAGRGISPSRSSIVPASFWTRHGFSIFMALLVVLWIGEAHVRSGFAWLNRQVTGIDLRSESNSQYIKIVGRGAIAEAHGVDLLVRFDEIAVRMVDRSMQLRFRDLGFSVWKDNRQVGEVIDRDVRGALNADASELQFKGRVFVVPGGGMHCYKGCYAKLMLTTSERSQPHFSMTENTGIMNLSINRSHKIVAPAPAEPAHWDTHLARAANAIKENRLDDAYRYFEDALEFIARKHGADHPYAAVALIRQAELHARMGGPTRQEQALLRAAGIANNYPNAEFQKPFEQGAWTDKEAITRRVADFYLQQQRFAEALAYYQRAYALIDEVSASDTGRIYKTVADSVGIATSACALRDWPVADQAMAEIQRHIGKIRPVDRDRFKYWTQAGAARIRNRNC